MLSLLLSASLVSVPVAEGSKARIDIIQADLRAGTTCTAIVEKSLERMKLYGGRDRLNAITAVPDDVLEAARAVDERLAQGRALRPLECVTVAIKDNIDVKNMPTTAGSIALAGNVAPADAPVVARLRSAGAIIIARTNMAEWAYSPRHTISSSAGETRNPYDPDIVPAGSSGGSASAVAADLVAVAIGTDTGNSIRGPSAHASLVGIRPSIGLVPIDGIVPLLAHYDSVGPMVATVRDAALVLDALTENPGGYSGALKADALRGKVIMVPSGPLAGDTVDADVARLFNRALKDLRKQGARIVTVSLDTLGKALGDGEACFSFRRDVRDYFKARGGQFAHYDPQFAYDAGLYAPESKEAFAFFLKQEDEEGDCPGYNEDGARQAARTRVETLMKEYGAAAIAYPSWAQPPATRKRWSEDYAGDNSQVLVPPTGLPGVTVPMGFLPGGAPSGLQLVGKYKGEADLLALAYAYEQATHHRKPPNGY